MLGMVTFLELMGLALGSALLFGLIVGAFSVYNGRMTRREITKVITEEERMTQALRADMKQIQKDMKQILEKSTAILERLAGKLLP